MKKLLYSTLFYLSVLPLHSNAQMVSTDIFLQGKYLEAAVAKNGCLGSGNNAPLGYHSFVSGKTPAKLAIVADPARDGFSVGTPAFFGDYIMPGTPDEQWAIQYNGTSVQVTRAAGDASFPTPLTGSTYDYKSTGNLRIAYWSGLAGGININQTTTIDVNRMCIFFSIKMVNTTAKTINNVYYRRAVDPDNEVEQFPTKGFSTHMKILNQSPDPMQKVGVSATGDSLRTYLGMHTKDCRAKAFYTKGGISSPPGDTYFNTGTASPITTSHSLTDSLYADTYIGLVFRLGNLSPGDSTSVNFFYALDRNEIDTVLSTVYTPLWLRDSAITANNKDTIYACDSSTIKLDITALGRTDWTWAPSPYLSKTSGTSNTALVAGIQTYTAVRMDTSFCKGADTMKITVIARAPIKPVITRSGRILSAGPGKFMSYQWMKDYVVIPGATSQNYFMTDSGCYSIITMDSNGCKGSDTLCVTHKELSVKETGVKNQINIHPNPATDKVFIELPLDIMYSLQDLSGRILVDKNTDKEIDLSKYSNGIYLLHFYNKDGQTLDVRKLLKQ